MGGSMGAEDAGHILGMSLLLGIVLGLTQVVISYFKGEIKYKAKKAEAIKKMHCNPEDLLRHEMNPYTKGRFEVKSQEQFAKEMDEFFDKFKNSKPVAIQAKGRPIEVVEPPRNCRNCGAPPTSNGCDYCGTGKEKRKPGPVLDQSYMNANLGVQFNNPISSFHLDVS